MSKEIIHWLKFTLLCFPYCLICQEVQSQIYYSVVVRSVLGVYWKDWCWSWNSYSLATWCKELTHLKRPWCWERLRAEGEGDNRGWDGWMASLTQWTWVWVNSGSWWWTGRPGVLWFTGSQRVGHNWANELNWRLFYFLLQLEDPPLFQNFMDHIWPPKVTCWSPNPPVCLYLGIGCSKDVIKVQFSSVQPLSHVQLFAIPWTAACQASLSITSSQNLLKLMSIESVMPSNHLTLCHPPLLLPSVFPISGSFLMRRFFTSGGQSIATSALASVRPVNIQDWFPLGWTLCSPRDSQESSPTPQFKSINFSALSLLYGPILTSIHDYWKNHSFD